MGIKFAKKALSEGAICCLVDDEDVQGENIIHVKDGLTALQDLAKYHRAQLTIPIIGITGSNGKTTTKELIHAVLSEKYNCFCNGRKFEQSYWGTAKRAQYYE